MAHPTINASLRQSNAYPTTSQQAMALTMRIEAKKAELENLTQLRDLSNALASQMQALEAKLATLKDGTECMLMVC
jgi:DASH complex subunit DAD2